MKYAYSGKNNGLTSCQRTIEHFKQTRKFGCWGGKDTKVNCDAKFECIYHPKNETKMQNKCDLHKGVIWKRNNPGSPFEYSVNYLQVVKDELLRGKRMPLKPMLQAFYKGRNYTNDFIGQFKKDFHFNSEEMSFLFQC